MGGDTHPSVVTADLAGMTFTVKLAKWIFPPNGFLGASTGCNGQKRGEDECEYGDGLHRCRQLAHRLAVFGQELLHSTALQSFGCGRSLVWFDALGMDYDPFERLFSSTHAS